MSAATTLARREVVYPESDGKPMADNTRQLQWIVTLYGNLAALFRHRDDVFVGGNQFWYPVEGEPEIVQAPDVYVVFGRPKGDRPSWKQWEEADVPLTVVFEVLSPGNTHAEMEYKYDFYEEHGAKEYYEYDPENNAFFAYVRGELAFRRIRPAHNFVSPRLGIRFDLAGSELVVYGPAGNRFLSFEELKAVEELAQHRADQAQQRADQAQQRADQAQQRADRLAELSIKLLAQQATPAEIEELRRLAGQS